MQSIPSWAFRGAEVVYYYDGPVGANYAGLEPGILELGSIYKIEWVEVMTVLWNDGSTSTDTFVKLVGIRDDIPKNKHRVEHTFYLARFKPLKTIETDMEEHFQKLLDVKDPADVA